MGLLKSNVPSTQSLMKTETEKQTFKEWLMQQITDGGERQLAKKIAAAECDRRLSVEQLELSVADIQVAANCRRE